MIGIQRHPTTSTASSFNLHWQFIAKFSHHPFVPLSASIAEASGPPKPLSLLNINHFYSMCITLRVHCHGGEMDYIDCCISHPSSEEESDDVCSRTAAQSVIVNLQSPWDSCVILGIAGGENAIHRKHHSTYFASSSYYFRRTRPSCEGRREMDRRHSAPTDKRVCTANWVKF